MDFSIIIPAKNESENIEKCIQSIKQNCQYPANLFEIIVVDNGSTDDTAQLAKSMGAQVHIKTDVTISFLRNLGASVAKGTILVFLDADCSVRMGWLKKASRYLGREDIACFGSPPNIPDNATWVQQTWFLVRYRGEKTSEVTWLESMNMFVRRSVFQAVNGFDETLITCEDVDISYRISKIGKIICDPDIDAVHHGEASTVREFFKKERWRGKSNYQGLMRHGLKMSEMPSLILPIYFGISAFTFFFCLIFQLFRLSFVVFILMQAPILGITFIKLRKKNYNMLHLINLSVLYNIYYLARFVSIFG